MPRKQLYPRERARAIILLKRGEATVVEVARLANVSQNLVRQWAIMEKIDWKKARERRLARAWRKTEKNMIGKQLRTLQGS
jgi:transposase-like protein